jgi:predicted nucleic acid-binding protein
LIVADSSFVYALLDPADARHREASAWYPSNTDDLATTPLVLCEVDYLADAHAGRAARDAFRRDVAAGAYVIEWWPTAAAEAVEIAERYGDLGVSLTDASLVALADRLETTRLATFDDRHFRAMRPLHRGAAFTLLPLDA